MIRVDTAPVLYILIHVVSKLIVPKTINLADIFYLSIKHRHTLSDKVKYLHIYMTNKTDHQLWSLTH